MSKETEKYYFPRIRFPIELAARINAWRLRQPVQPNFTGAVRQLLAVALDSDDKKDAKR